MNPIPTTNAMKPAAGKGIPSFPTPVIKDTVIVEVVNAWKGDYVPLEYGAKWDDHPHASQQGSFPDHKLISQSPTSEDGQWVKRIWANDRVDQDTYNYAIRYSGGSDAHPIYIRTYLEPRDTYAPVLDGTADPLFPGALLVDEEVTRTDGEFDSRYVQVTRVYETLPGPVIPTKRFNERGDLETINTQTVASGTQPDPDGLLVTQSQIAQQEVSKGVKTTATVDSHSQLLIKERKDGLLGETVTTDDIVDPTTNPDALTQSIISSTVQQISKTKAVKRTTTSSGPTSLTGQKNGGGLLGEQTVTETIVPSGSSATPLSLNVVTSDVTPIDSAKSKRTTVTGLPAALGATSLVDSPLGLVPASVNQSIVAPNTIPQGSLTKTKDSIDPIDKAKSQREQVTVNGWPINTGVDYDDQLGLGVYYRETIVSPSEYLNAPFFADLSYKDYKPIDQWKSLKKEIDRAKIKTALEQQYYKTSIDVPVNLPNKLLGVTVYYGQSYGAGQTESSGGGASTGSYNESTSTSEKSSWSIGGDIYFNIQKGFNGSIPGFKHIFFLEIGSDGKIEENDIARIISSYDTFGIRVQNPPIIYRRWPYLQTRTENLVLITGGRSKTESKSKSESVGINGISSTESNATSFDVDVRASSVNVPETLHGPITIAEEMVGSASDTKGVGEPTKEVRPKTLATTQVVINGQLQAAPTFPTGKFLISSDVELYKWGFVKVTATTVEVTPDYV